MDNKSKMIFVAALIVIAAILVLVAFWLNERPWLKYDSGVPGLRATDPLVNVTVPPGWNQFVASDTGYSFLFPETWYLADGGSEANMTLSNHQTPDISKQPKTVIMELTTLPKPVDTDIETILKNGVPKTDKASIQVTTGTTASGHKMAKILFGQGAKEQAVFGIERTAGDMIILNFNGYISDPAVDEIARSFRINLPK